MGYLLASLYVAANKAWIDVEKGEWIIEDQLGFYPCKNDILTKKYKLKSSQDSEITYKALLDAHGEVFLGESIRINYINKNGTHIYVAYKTMQDLVERYEREGHVIKITMSDDQETFTVLVLYED